MAQAQFTPRHFSLWWLMRDVGAIHGYAKQTFLLWEKAVEFVKGHSLMGSMFESDPSFLMAYIVIKLWLWNVFPTLAFIVLRCPDGESNGEPDDLNSTLQWHFYRNN